MRSEKKCERCTGIVIMIDLPLHPPIAAGLAAAATDRSRALEAASFPGLNFGDREVEGEVPLVGGSVGLTSESKGRARGREGGKLRANWTGTRVSQG